MKKFLCLMICSLSFVGCSNEPEPQIMSAKFNSMDECLASIKSKTGEALDPMTDKPEHVSGFLGKTGLQFNCEVKHTGTEGTYVDGWYQEKITN
ncbi:hypothetical protein IC763_03000 [Acinetobacter seifertii]|nr:hypothetical protein IC763_03000 [Acinetobacter seifertii]